MRPLTMNTRGGVGVRRTDQLSQDTAVRMGGNVSADPPHATSCVAL